MGRVIIDRTLLCNENMRVAFVLESGILIAVHLDSKRLTPQELEEIAERALYVEEEINGLTED